MVGRVCRLQAPGSGAPGAAILPRPLRQRRNSEESADADARPAVRSWPAGTARHADPGHHALHDQRARCGPHRSQDPPRDDTLPRRDRRVGLGLRHQPRVHERTRGVLADEVRLAGPGTAAQSDAAVQDEHRRARHPLRPPALAGPGRHAAGADARVAWLHLRVHQGHRPADRPGSTRRAGERRLSRRRHLAAGVRLLRAARRARLQPRAHGRHHRHAHGAPRLHPLRHPGRRLGRHHQPASSRSRTRRTSPGCTSTSAPPRAPPGDEPERRCASRRS